MKNILLLFFMFSAVIASPSSDKVADLADKHENANGYHAGQEKAFKNSKTILSKTLLTQSENIFELGREANLVYSEKLSEGIYKEMKIKKYMFEEIKK